MNADTLNTLSDVAGADIAREKAEAAATVALTAKDAAELAANSSEESKDAAAKSEAAAKQYADNAAAIVTTDPTLTVKGAPADAKAVGDRINAIKIETDKTLTISGAAADAAAVGGIVLPRVVVHTEAGSNVVLSDGEKSVSGVAADGSFSAALPHDGEWTVTATLGTGAATETVQAEYCRTKTLTLTYYTLTVTVKAGSTVTAQCKDKTVSGTVPESGSIKLYLPVAGTWTVTATLGDETTEGSVEVSEYRDYPLELAYVHIYGASWDGTSTTKWSRTDEAAEFTDPVPYVAGASSYGSPFDSLQPWAGMTVSERTGGTMVSIPKFWYKLTQNGRGMSIQIADRAVEGYSVSPAHMDRGDGHGERDVVYIGRYHCNGTYKSGTGSPRVNMTRSSARSGIHNLGSTIWQSDFTMRFTLWLLYIVEFADWNSQAKIGYGCSPNSNTFAMGYTDSMPYHTGTDQSSRATYGGTQYRNIEGLWDNVYDWCDGCYYNSNGLNIILNPSEFSDSGNGTAVGVPSNGWPSAFNVKTNGGFPTFIPTSASGNDATYSCDDWYFSSSNPCLYVGGNYSHNSNYGLFYVNYNAASNYNGNIGCRFLFDISNLIYFGTDSRTPHGEDRHFGSGLVHPARGAGTSVQLKGGYPMKRAGKLFDTLISDDNLLRAIDEVNRTHHWKRGHKPNTCTAWVEETKAQRVEDLRRILVGGFEPKKPHVSQRWDANARKWRTISEPAQWPDQYVHHALIQVLQPRMMQGMDFYCCGSIRKRGPHREKNAIQRWMKYDRKGTKYEFCGDIRHFYDSLTPEVVMARMRQLYKDCRVLDLIRRVIRDGVKLGTYTSQWFANAVLQPLDQLIRESGLCKHYARYMDNITTFGPNRRKLRKLRILVESWLNAHDLKLKGDWQVFPVAKRQPKTPLAPPRRGFARAKGRLPDAVGYRYGRGYTIPRKRNLLHIKRALARYRKRRRKGKPIAPRAAASLLSRLGQLRHCNNYHLYQWLFRGERVVRDLKHVVREHRRKENLTWTMFLAQRAAQKSSRPSATLTPA